MKTLMVVLGLSLFTLCVAEVLHLDQQAKDTNSFQSPSVECACHCEIPNSDGNCLKALKELEDKQRIIDKDLRRHIQGKSVQWVLLLNETMCHIVFILPLKVTRWHLEQPWAMLEILDLTTVKSH